MTVRFHAFNTSGLAAELSQGRPCEKVQFQYLLGSELLLAFLLYYSLLFGAFVSWLFFLQALIVLLITFIGIYEAFRANGGANGQGFLVKSVCLLVPITINTAILSEALGIAYTYFAPYIADPSVFVSPNRPLALIEFVWAPIFTGIVFWRLNVHIARIAATKSSNKGFNADAGKAGAG